MTKSTTDSNDKLIDDFNTVIADTEQLLRSVAASGGDKAGSMRAGVEKNIDIAKQRLRQLQDSALEKGRDAVRAGDEYVHDNPWQSMGVAVGVAAVAGIFIGMMLANRR